jgi:hypothetical protein
MNLVKSVWHDDENFVVVLHIEPRMNVTYTFPISRLAEGASLQVMMNEKVKNTLRYSQPVVARDNLVASARAGVAALRAIIEPYFERRRLAEVNEDAD